VPEIVKLINFSTSYLIAGNKIITYGLLIKIKIKIIRNYF